MEYYSAFKKNPPMPATTWMNLEGITLSGKSQTREEHAAWFRLREDLRAVESTETESRGLVGSGRGERDGELFANRPSVSLGR